MRAEALNWKGMRVGGIVVFGRLDSTSEGIGRERGCMQGINLLILRWTKRSLWREFGEFDKNPERVRVVDTIGD